MSLVVASRPAQNPLKSHLNNSEMTIQRVNNPPSRRRSESISVRFRTDLVGGSGDMEDWREDLSKARFMSDEEELIEKPFSVYFGHVDEVTPFLRISRPNSRELLQREKQARITQP
jgi:hypothetical protein